MRDGGLRLNWVALFFTVDLGFALGITGDWGNTEHNEVLVE
jgi:hypothetical protein